MANESTEIHEAVSDIANAAGQLTGENAVLEDALEHAEEQLEQAQEAARAIADAALQSEIGKRVTEIEERVGQWQETASAALETMAATIATQANQIAELQTQLTALAKPPETVTVVVTDQSLTGETLAAAEAVAAQIAEPISQGQSEPIAAVVQQQARRKVRLI